MCRPHRRPPPVKAAFDVHEAAHISAHHHVGAGGFDCLQLGFEHGRRDFRHLNREEAPKPTTLVSTLELATRHARSVQQGLAHAVQTEATQPVTRSVKGNGAVGACATDIDLVVGEEPGELHRPRGHTKRRVLRGTPGEQRWSVMNQHVAARARRNDDRSVSGVEDRHGVFCHGGCLFGIPGVEGGLAAARLIKGEGHVVASPLQEPNCGDANAGREAVDQTRHEKLAHPGHVFDVSGGYGRRLMDAARSHEDAIDLLVATDADLAAVVDRYGRPNPFRRSPTFATLTLLILEQQVSLESAAAAFGRLQASTVVEPEAVLRLTDAELRTVGFSRQKTRYVRALAEVVVSNHLPLSELAGLPDDAVRSVLTSVPGIGPWTAEVFLLSCLGRPDIWPIGDRALQVGTTETLGSDTIPTPAELAGIGERWRPFRSTAAQLIWHGYLGKRKRNE